MSPDELKRLVRTGDCKALAKALGKLREDERRALSSTAAAILAGNSMRRWTPAALEKRRRWAESTFGMKLEDLPQDLRYAVNLAALGLCSWTHAKTVRIGRLEPKYLDPFTRVLLDRRPDWLDRWIDHHLSRRAGGLSHWFHWPLLRRLIEAGACQTPTSEGYVHCMANALGTSRRKANSVLDCLLEDPDLLKDEVWRFLELDTADLNPVGRQKGDLILDWHESLAKLGHRGKLDHARLVETSFRIMAQPFARVTLERNTHFHELLAPTTAQRIAHQHEYLDLLGSAVPQVAGCALAGLAIIAKAGKLNGGAFLKAVPLVFRLRPKAQPLAALRLMQLCLKDSPKLNMRMAFAAASALRHESADVQGAALDLIESIGIDAHVSAAIAGAADHVAATHRKRLGTLISHDGAAKRKRASNVVANRSPTLSGSDWSDIDPRWRDAVRLNACIAAMRDGGELPALDFDPMGVPRLDPASEIKPIKTLDELIDAMARALEALDSGDEFERILDGLSRLCDQRPSDFESRVAALRYRAAKLNPGEKLTPGAAAEIPSELGLLIFAWVDRKVRQARTRDWDDDAEPYRFLWRRLLELAQRVVRGDGGPLLAAPTHRGGWIDPRVFVSRAAAVGMDRDPSHRFDLIAALLRLAPDHRPEALSRVRSLPGEMGAAIRFALGDGAKPKGRDSAIWIAAARARNSHGQVAEINIIASDEGPDTVLPSRYIYRAGWKQWRSDDSQKSRTIAARTLDVERTPQVLKRHLADDRPTVLMDGWFDRSSAAAWLLHWYSTIWPARLDSFFVSGALAYENHLENVAVKADPYYIYLRPLLDPDTPWSEIARLVLILGCIGRDAEIRAVAVDVLLQGIDDGRCVGDELGHTVASLTADAWVKFKGLSVVLAQVSRASALHRWVVARLIDVWLAIAPQPLPAQAHPMLELHFELRTELGDAVRSQSRTALEATAGSGRLARAARRLLALECSGDMQARHTAFEQAIKGRVDRAQRWARRS